METITQRFELLTRNFSKREGAEKSSDKNCGAAIKKCSLDIDQGLNITQALSIGQFIQHQRAHQTEQHRSQHVDSDPSGCRPKTF